MQNTHLVKVNNTDIQCHNKLKHVQPREMQTESPGGRRSSLWWWRWTDMTGGVGERPLQLFKADGAEQEDGVEQQETEAQSAVQPPAVQVDTQNLRRTDGLVSFDLFTAVST